MNTIITIITQTQGQKENSKLHSTPYVSLRRHFFSVNSVLFLPPKREYCLRDNSYNTENHSAESQKKYWNPFPSLSKFSSKFCRWDQFQ